MKYTKPVVDANLRSTIFNDFFAFYNGDETEFNGHDYKKINDRQYGCILTDLNGNERYVRIGVIVAEEREDMTARELMQLEIDNYVHAQGNKLRRAAERAEKAKRDKKLREEKKKNENENK